MRQILTTAALVAAALPLSLFGCGSAGADGERMEISREKTRPATPGPHETFTGEVSVKPLYGTVDRRNSSAAEVTFSPRARSAWHTHPAGQTLVVTAGTGWVQEWGQAKQQLNPGDVVWTPPGVKHWHGATESTALTHIAIQEHVDGTAVNWLEYVSDEQYTN
ncbi:cupin domain-containing protein [Mycobacterium sp. ITM-2016-00318]|uniref:(R)-mandelonitrile lyase n=1 Tax=Mycobacterium sp. ITM-2016-00318 TaxID=2099693 RepID=UPI000CF86744|nr:cupin domain-containing protein [Mycobacterium sp. ITM-2016-00318]WNG94480.1 cupin domain-containing protein [Mycobacterium sp. ITM-2016-00318]